MAERRLRAPPGHPGDRAAALGHDGTAGGSAPGWDDTTGGTEDGDTWRPGRMKSVSERGQASKEPPAPPLRVRVLFS